ncbi:hypothetical protein DIURU_000639 [Diutina rugosa]|uniref:Gag1-like clamp domain-containing protein n=1 Tax=Diutina rugosa TaxID=5481 RepID=A0A642UX43_DIURU|nr:uncharacterized protein DIURU_000639 [Diutina rugosa]KAA8907319.1 hypothetical protein DIURU_000639 [Diutina rugosa]
MSSPKSSSASRAVSKKPSFLRRVAAEWSQFFDRVRAAAHDDSSDESVIDELFEDSERDESLSRLMRPQRGNTATDEAFLEKYRQYKSLDKIASSMAPSPQPQPSPDTGSATEVNSFRDVDVCKMRADYLKDSASSDGTVDDSQLGTKLWHYRRAKWLDPSPAAARRVAAPALAPAPKEQYVKIYTQLVDKGRPLKQGLNLGDVVTVINAGWVAEERWDRAAKGLP